jgi:hypothetical protein
MSSDLEETLYADHERVIAWVCAIDIAKAQGKVCVRVQSCRGGCQFRPLERPHLLQPLSDRRQRVSRD